METDRNKLALTRRASLQAIAGAAAATLLPTLTKADSKEPARRTGMGLVIYDCKFRRTWMRQQKPEFDFFEPLTFLKHCRELGAGGMQAELGVLNTDDIARLRGFADQHNLYVEAIVKPPKDHADLERFEAEIKTARDVGVQAARTTIIPGRRYERFSSLAEFREFERRGREMLQRAAPIVEKHRVPLAVENHKDQRIDERVALFEQLGSEFIGACLDTGNSFALLDGAYEPITALAPFAFSVHLKDQALREYEDGFLLADIPLGQGSFDLKRMVEIIKRAKPKIRFVLELITRDPLRVPCLNDDYWVTMPSVPARDLARTLRFVREHPAKHLQEVNALPLEKQVQVEDANVSASLRYAAKELGL